MSASRPSAQLRCVGSPPAPAQQPAGPRHSRVWRVCGPPSGASSTPHSSMPGGAPELPSCNVCFCAFDGVAKRPWDLGCGHSYCERARRHWHACKHMHKPHACMQPCSHRHADPLAAAAPPPPLLLSRAGEACLRQSPRSFRNCPECRSRANNPHVNISLLRLIDSGAATGARCWRPCAAAAPNAGQDY